MHYNIYYFTDKFDFIELCRLNKKISIIYRNHNKKIDYQVLKKLTDFCKKQKRSFFISNNLKLALKFNASGLYLSAFNKIPNYKNKNFKKNFKIIGSAHNYKEIREKEIQGCSEIFLAPLFYNSKNKKYLKIVRFSYLTLLSSKKIIALGGINQSNFSLLKMLKIIGFAGINWIKKTGLQNIARPV